MCVRGELSPLIIRTLGAASSYKGGGMDKIASGPIHKDSQSLQLPCRLDVTRSLCAPRLLLSANEHQRTRAWTCSSAGNLLARVSLALFLICEHEL